MDDGGGLGHPAFLICHCDYISYRHAHLLSEQRIEDGTILQYHGTVQLSRQAMSQYRYFDRTRLEMRNIGILPYPNITILRWHNGAVRQSHSIAVSQYFNRTAL